ncbi:hypothetical protein ANCDUO_08639 [Ancylostoma duodenale]|uniref:Uncharacterized protein n=1 Tax=Ancylostoma duodenale TaxID=51022 RepID=A0A0C2GVC8_9BILA|nr:hypothetical protein ANCDUO_08639 [Ancylostoma duodenale]
MATNIALSLTPLMNDSLTWENCNEMDEIANSPLLRAYPDVPVKVGKFLHSRIHQHVTKLNDILLPRKDGCQIIHDATYCFFIRLPYNCALWACYTTTIMIALERCLATIFLRKYYGNRTAGPLLVVAQLIITSALLLFVYLPTRFSGVIVYYCLAMSSVQPMYTVIPLSLTMLIQTSAVLVFVKLKMVNKEIRLKLRNAGDLCGRYQVEETLRYQLDAAVMPLRTTTFVVPESKCHQEKYCTGQHEWVQYKRAPTVKTELSCEIATTSERYEEELRKMWG